METPGVPSGGNSQKSLRRATHYRWFILTLMFLFLVITFADRGNMGIVLPYVKKDFHLTNLQAGALASFFSLGYAIAQLPAGLIAGGIGARVMTSVCLFAFSGITFLIGLSPGAVAMKWLRLCLGLGEGPAWVGAGGLLKAWFPRKEQGTATGIFMAAGQVAQVIVPPVGVAIMALWGWRAVFYWFAAPGVVLAIIWYVFVRNRPQESPYCNAPEQEYILQSSAEARSQEDPQAKSMWVDAIIRVRRGMKALTTNGQVLSSWNLWANSIVIFLVTMCMWGMGTWIPSYLINERHLSMIRMGFLAAVPLAGTVVGFVGGGWASDKLWRGRRKPMMFIAAIGGTIMMYLLANAPPSQAILAVLLFVNGIVMTLSFSLYASYPLGLTTRKTYPMALAMNTMCGSLGGFLSPMIAGYLLDVFKTFNVVFYFFTLVLAVSFVLILTEVEPLQTIEAE